MRIKILFHSRRYISVVTVTASGTFGFGMEYNEFVSIEEYGGFGAKGLTRVPREGNKPPRIAETPSGILNSVGLQNPGVEHFAKHIMPILAEYDTNVIANMSGNTIGFLNSTPQKLIFVLVIQSHLLRIEKRTVSTNLCISVRTLFIRFTAAYKASTDTAAHTLFQRHLTLYTSAFRNFLNSFKHRHRTA